LNGLIIAITIFICFSLFFSRNVKGVRV